MSAIVGQSLPEPLMAVFALEERERAEGQCFLLITTDIDQTPRPCLLSIGEMLAVDERHLRIVVWPHSQTTVNLDRGLTVLLVSTVPPDVFHIRAVPKRLPGAALARFELTIDTVEVDGHEGMPVTQPMWFTVREDLRAETLASWQEQLGSLRH